MRERRIFQILPSIRFRPTLPDKVKKQGRIGEHLCFFLLCVIFAPILLSGCGHHGGGSQAKSALEEANYLFNQGCYQASLDKYAQSSAKYPTQGDRILFEMGIVYAYPKNEQKDYQKALECFQKILKDYPASEYRQNSEMMIFSLTNVAIKDQTIATQQAQLKALRQDVACKVNEISELQKKVAALEKRIIATALRTGTADRIVIEKKARRLQLFANGEVLKTYKIALGGNPIGPKEREGDKKTPEGTYVIDSKNQRSRYHRSLHISYPNEKDRKRAEKLGVSPGGDIMIHGIKKGFSWVGDAHTEVDWTQGCIAVTDEEIEEISKLTPNGTIVEIRP